jgi:hypothetical protein
MCAEFEATTDLDTRRKFADRVIVALVRHSVTEEKYSYPMVRRLVAGGAEPADQRPTSKIFGPGVGPVDRMGDAISGCGGWKRNHSERNHSKRNHSKRNHSKRNHFCMIAAPTSNHRQSAAIMQKRVVPCSVRSGYFTGVLVSSQTFELSQREPAPRFVLMP